MFVHSAALLAAVEDTALAATREAELDAASRAIRALYETQAASCRDVGSFEAARAAYTAAVCVGRWGELRAQRAAAEASALTARSELLCKRAAVEHAVGLEDL